VRTWRLARPRYGERRAFETRVRTLGGDARRDALPRGARALLQPLGAGILLAASAGVDGRDVVAAGAVATALPLATAGVHGRLAMGPDAGRARRLALEVADAVAREVRNEQDAAGRGDDEDHNAEAFERRAHDDLRRIHPW